MTSLALVEVASVFKACSKCHRLLPVTCFYVNKGRAYGRHSHCKECSHARMTNSHQQTRRSAYLARAKVNNAIASGRLARKSCEVCGEVKAQAHHDDYTKPLDVRWLCVTHHNEWHKNNTPIYPLEQAA